MSYLLIVIVICGLTAAWWKCQSKPIQDLKGRLVVVTGCDSGIGLELAQRLHGLGFRVVACCMDRNGEGGQLLSTLDNVVIARLDLRMSEHIADLTRVVQEEIGRGKVLHCLVNNAGVMTFAPFAWQNEASIINQINVNLTGTVLLTRALLPLLRHSKGRIITVSSPQGLIASPKMSLYCATKAALETFIQSLRREVGHEVHVIVVRPCSLPTQTRILQDNANQLKQMRQDLGEDSLKEFENEMTVTEQFFRSAFESASFQTEVRDAQLFEHFRDAILQETPKYSYTAAPFYVRYFLDLCQILPTSFVDILFQYDIPVKMINLATTV